MGGLLHQDDRSKGKKELGGWHFRPLFKGLSLPRVFAQ